MTFWSSVALTEILRGLAFSATGISKPQHAGLVARRDLLGVEVVAEDQLPAEHPARPLGGDQFFGVLPGPAVRPGR